MHISAEQVDALRVEAHVDGSVRGEVADQAWQATRRRDFLTQSAGACTRRRRARRSRHPAQCQGGRTREHRGALSGHRKFRANRPGLRQRRQARGADGQRCRRHQVTGRRQAEPDHLRCAERYDRDPHGNRPFDHRLQAVGDPRLLRQRADIDRERGGRARESAAVDRLEHRPAQQGSPLYLHAFRARFAVRAGATANGEAGERQAEGGGGVREHRIRHLDLQWSARTGARRGCGDRLVRAVFGRLDRCQPADQQGQGLGREHAVPGFLLERPHSDHPRDQAGRSRDRHQWRLRRVRHSRLLQERGQSRGRPAGRRALEPRHRRQCRRR